jgi:hypothetical protein
MHRGLSGHSDCLVYFGGVENIEVECPHSRSLQQQTVVEGYIHDLLSVARNRFDYYGTAYYRWKRELRRAGFQMLREEGLCWFPFSRTSNSPLVTLCTTAESRIGLRHLPVFSPWIVFAAQKDS